MTEEGELREPRAPDWGRDGSHVPTADDIREWEEYQRAYRAWEQLVDFTRVIDLSGLIDGEFKPPEMLTEGRIVAGATTVVAGLRANGKSYVVAHDAVQVMKAGHNVVWVDLEMGRVRSAERFKQLGLTSGEAHARLTYMESPRLVDDADMRAYWAGLMQRHEPALVVVDAVTEALSVAGLDDYRGGEVAKWHTWYATPALLQDAAVVYIDHVPHEKKRAIGAVHKENQAKVVLIVEQTKPFDREHVGEVLVTCTKNSYAAAIPDKQRYRIGQDPLAGRFVFEPVEARAMDHGEGPGERLDAVGKAKNAIVARLHGLTEADGLTVTELRALVAMKNSTVAEALDELVNNGLVSNGKQGRSVLYWEAPTG